MPLAPGSKLTYYEILAPLGAGAMGEVYRARDTRLGREVAIKVLPEQFVGDEERLRRFEREAKSLAALNHPGVAGIFGLDQVGDTCFLVLELVPGETLEERLRRGALPLAEALDVCRQIAAGVEAAHEAGVIHRDLKPANVCLTPDGTVKVLDFGLAKPASEDRHGSTHDSVLSTEAGRLLGTPTYMAPEQARGRPIDKRVDVWAFGCVLYECLTGRRPFDGETLTDVLTTVLHAEVDLGALPRATPARVRELLDRCLAKDPRRRLRDIGEARLVLEEPGEAGGEPTGAARLAWLPWSLFLAAAGTLVVVLLRPPETQSNEAPVWTSIRLPYGTNLGLDTNVDEQSLIAISPDGLRVAFAATADGMTRLYVRALDTLDAVPLPGTEDAGTPFFSPDGRWIAFIARGRLMKVSVDGGLPIDLAPATGQRGGAWGPDGTIVYPMGMTSGLVRVPATGGRPIPVTEIETSRGERTHRWPCFLPGGKEIAYTVGLGGSSNDYEDSEIQVVTLATGAKRSLDLRASMVRFTETGLVLFARAGRLCALELAALGGSDAPEPTVVAQAVAGVHTSGAVHFDVSRDGTLVYAEADPRAADRELAWVSREGVVERLSLPAHPYAWPALSPDGSRLVVSEQSERFPEGEVVVYDLERGSVVHLGQASGGFGARWSLDGKSLVFAFRTATGNGIVRCSADGRGTPEVLGENLGLETAPLSWTPDGSQLITLVEAGPPTGGDIVVLTPADHQVRTLLASNDIEYGAALSPDGKWLAAASVGANGNQVWVQAWPDGGARWPISDHGALPCWSRDGSELYFVEETNMMAVRVTGSPSFATTAPERLFSLELQTNGIARNWDVAPDGRFLVILRSTQRSFSEHLVLVQHGLDGLRAR